MKQIVRDFVDTMDVVGEKLESFPMSGKTGVKLGWMMAFNPVVAPIATSAAIGGAAVYGLYKVAKYVVEKEDNR